jgi:hypothetical protein
MHSALANLTKPYPRIFLFSLPRGLVLDQRDPLYFAEGREELLEFLFGGVVGEVGDVDVIGD